MDNHSPRWIAVSFCVFIVVEVVLGMLIGKPLVRSFVSHPTALKIEVLLILASYFAGGFLIGLVSPSYRTLEPAVAAAMAACFTWLIGFFTPLCFFGFALNRMLVGAAAAFALAMAGAGFGEKAAARFRSRAAP